MNKFYISALLLPVVCISAAYAEGSLDTTCVNSISAAQGCLKKCVDEGPVDVYDNRLQKCVTTNSIFSPELLDCCGMSETIDCNTEMRNTDACLDFTLTPVRQALTTYFTCVVESSSAPYCHPDFCVGVIAGGYGMNLDNDFDLGEKGGVGSLMRVATDCTALDSFMTNVCKTIGSCCQPCASHLANVTEAVTNHLLLPSYNQDLLESSGGGCTNMVCNLPPPTLPPTLPVPPASHRQLEGEESAAAAAASGGDGDNAVSEDAVVLATECNDELETNVIVYNESHAVGVFFECITKKVGRIMMEAEQEGSSSGSALEFSFLTVSALASVILAIAVIH